MRLCAEKAALHKPLNRFVFNFQTLSQTLARFICYEYYGYPSDFVFQYRDGIEEVLASRTTSEYSRRSRGGFVKAAKTSVDLLESTLDTER